MFMELITSLNEYKQTNNIYALQMFTDIKKMIQDDLISAYELSQPLIEKNLNLFRNSTSFFQFLLQYFNLVEVELKNKKTDQAAKYEKDYLKCILELDSLKTEINNLRKESEVKEKMLNDIDEQQSFYKDFYLKLQEIYKKYYLHSDITIEIIETMILENQNIMSQQYDFYHDILKKLKYKNLENIESNEDYENLILQLLPDPFYEDLLEKLLSIANKPMLKESTYDKTLILNMIDEINSSHLHFYQQLILKLFNENITRSNSLQYQTLILEMLNEQEQINNVIINTKHEIKDDLELEKQIETLEKENENLLEMAESKERKIEQLNNTILEMKQKISKLNIENEQFIHNEAYYQQQYLESKGAYEAINKRCKELQAAEIVIGLEHEKEIQKLKLENDKLLETNENEKRYNDECVVEIEKIRDSLTAANQTVQQLKDEKEACDLMLNAKNLTENEFNELALLKNLFLQFLIYHFVLYYKSLDGTFTIDKNVEYQKLIVCIKHFESYEDKNIFFNYIIHQMYSLLGEKQHTIEHCEIKNADLEKYVKKAEDFIKTNYLNETIYNMCNKYNLEYKELDKILHIFSKMVNLVQNENDIYKSTKKIVDVLQRYRGSGVSNLSYANWLANKLGNKLK